MPRLPGVGTETQARRRPAASAGRWASGGTIGNEELTAMTAIVLLALLGALGITILRVGQLLNPHMFIGMMLLGPVLLKMISTGWRFIRYYTGSAPYVSKGPPPFIMRERADRRALDGGGVRNRDRPTGRGSVGAQPIPRIAQGELLRLARVHGAARAGTSSRAPALAARNFASTDRGVG